MKLSAQEEEFARLVALGSNQTEAYRKATKSKAKDETVYVQASKWAHKARIRIEALRAAAKTKAEAKYVYDYEDAMREIDEAHAIARAKDDPKAMISASALKAKLSGLETEARKNDRPPFEDLSDEALAEVVDRNMREAGFTLQ